MKAQQVLACVFCVLPILSYANTLIVGLENGTTSLIFPTTEYSVNPITGAVTTIGHTLSTGYYPTSSSPISGAFLALSPVNLYSVDSSTGTSFLYACPTCPGVGDHAYDPANGIIYALGTVGLGGPPTLFQLVDSGVPYPGFPTSHASTYRPIGSLTIPGIKVMEYVDGLGLYGTDGISGYLINETTGQATLLATLRWMTNPSSITGLAYDADTHRLLATSGSYEATFGKVYLIDPSGGTVTLLNGSAPNMIGIAAVNIPEPQSAGMLIAGLAGVMAIRKKMFRRTKASRDAV